MTEPERDDGRLVELPGGWLVPERFRFTSVQWIGDTEVQFHGAVIVDDGRPRLAWLNLGPVAGAGVEPLDAHELRAIDLVAVLHSGVQTAMLEYTPKAHPFTRIEEYEDLATDVESQQRFADDLDRAYDDALVTAQRSSYRRVTPELLRRVLALHAQGGIKEVMDELGYSERNARRLLARARKELK